MKQLLFLLLFPCLALAQYQGNGNQKITLGEQTTADGLVWRGIRADTTSKIVPFSDTSAYIILDTVEKTLWLYKAGQIPKWQQVGGSTLDTATMLLPYWRSGRFSGVLPVANGGTGATSLSPNNYLIRTNSSGIFDTSAIYETGGNVRIGTTENSTTGGFTNTSLYIKQIANGTGGGGLHIEQSDNTNVAFFGFSNDAFRIGTSYRTTGSIKPIEFFGSVGVGTNNPAGAFEVYKSSASTIDVARFGGNNGYATFNNYGDLLGTYGTTISSLTAAYTTNTAAFGTFSNSDLAIITNNARRATVKNTGEFGIGTASPAVQFHTTGGVRFAGLASITDLRTDADGDLFNGSDFNLKNSIDTINFGLSDVLKLKPVSFNWNNEGRNISEYKSMGFIAQDVMDVIPNATSTMGDGDMQVDYNAIVATLTKAIQEQQALIKALEQRILILENK